MRLECNLICNATRTSVLNLTDYESQSAWIEPEVSSSRLSGAAYHPRSLSPALSNFCLSITAPSASLAIRSTFIATLSQSALARIKWLPAG